MREFLDFIMYLWHLPRWKRGKKTSFRFRRKFVKDLRRAVEKPHYRVAVDALFGPSLSRKLAEAQRKRRMLKWRVGIKEEDEGDDA